ncbi:MAG: aminotransferase class V-fold PLP-dependent enzyme, partial [Hyphomicrobiaceae bacterium]|nr:aminotransferase class V-fold PLP-dependent enzyme [Hyphomicrobiaceae bacterium]
MRDCVRVYLDHNAGSMLRPRAQEAMLAALADAGNASSIHAEGRRARARIEAARGPVSRLVGGSAKALVFTSGASEAIQTVLSPVWRSGGGERVFRQLLVGATEHPSVLAGGRFAAEAVT